MLRAYWRNYYEQTDALLWVIDSADCVRMQVRREHLGPPSLLLCQGRLLQLPLGDTSQSKAPLACSRCLQILQATALHLSLFLSVPLPTPRT